VVEGGDSSGTKALSSLLAVFAHPDDETFRCGGALALLARQGVRVQILTATRGQAGSCGDPPLCRPEVLGTVREAELRCACAALGLEPPILLNYQDGALARVSEIEAVNRIMAIVQELRPQVLLTWPPDGLSGHPDHVAVSRWTGLAFQQAAVLESDAPASLYHLVLPRSIADRLGLVHLQTIPDEAVTLTVDVTPVWEQKLAAVNCHRTQLGVSPIMAADDDQQRIFLGREYFRRVQARTNWDFCLELGTST
jgi:LmbE family N-acetylglucosaminyl deacetylase